MLYVYDSMLFSKDKDYSAFKKLKKRLEILNEVIQNYIKKVKIVFK